MFSKIKFPRLQSSLLLSRPVIFIVYIPVLSWGLRTSWQSFLGILSWQFLFLNIAVLEGLSIATFLLVLLFEKMVESQVSFNKDSTEWFVFKYLLCFLPAIISIKFYNRWFWQTLSTQGLDQLSLKQIPFGELLFLVIGIILVTAIRNNLKEIKARARLENSFKEAQFRALKAQLNPHFLFNTLNLLLSEIQPNPKKAETIVEEFSQLLRGILKASSERLLTFRQELELLDHYLRLQKMRFEDRFEYQLDISENCMDLQVPSLLLQPFVENSLQHGFASRKKTGKLIIEAKRNESLFLISIQDNGKGFNQSRVKEGYGTTIVKDTLELLYGDQHTLIIQSIPEKGTTISIALPIEDK